MAGRGPAPKPAARRAHHGSLGDITTIEFTPSPQPGLPSDTPWPDRTVEWWKMWGDSPLSDRFSTADWDFLIDTALLHAAVWSGRFELMGELRLRVAKFGQTPEDRARLRIQFAEADQTEAKAAKRVVSARQRRGPLKADPKVIQAAARFGS